MNASDLKPASAFAQRYGVKMLSYGAPGSGKTPAMKTAPNPVILLCETGAGSLRDAHNIPACDGTTLKGAHEFFEWLEKSNEAKKFDTICIDSVTQFAELKLRYEEANKKHGMQAYGEMAKYVLERINKLYYMHGKHVYAIAKEGLVDINGTMCTRPRFPGQQLPSEIPHLFDVILHAERIDIPQQGLKSVPAFRCMDSFSILARDRFGILAEYEPQDLNAIITKSMAPMYKGN